MQRHLLSDNAFTVLERRYLIKDEAGRPMLYGTTPVFLEAFSLKSLRDLPTLREYTELSEESRQTFVIVTHNEEFARRSDRTFRMQDGLLGTLSKRAQEFRRLGQRAHRMVPTRFTISLAKSMKAWAPLEELSNTTPGMP